MIKKLNDLTDFFDLGVTMDYGLHVYGLYDYGPYWLFNEDFFFRKYY